MQHTSRGWAVRFTRSDGSYFYSASDDLIGYQFFRTRKLARAYVRECKAHGIGKFGAAVLYATLTLNIQG